MRDTLNIYNIYYEQDKSPPPANNKISNSHTNNNVSVYFLYKIIVCNFNIEL